MNDEIRKALLAVSEDLILSASQDWNYGKDGDVADCVRNALFAVAGCIQIAVLKEDK